MKISLAFHIVGVVLFLGSFLVLTRVMTIFEDPSQANTQIAKLVKKIFFGMTLPGLLIVIVSGLYQLGTRGMKFYMTQGWFHIKITLVLLLLIIVGCSFFDILKLKKGQILNKKRLTIFHGLTSLCMIVIIFLTILGR